MFVRNISLSIVYGLCSSRPASQPNNVGKHSFLMEDNVGELPEQEIATRSYFLKSGEQIGFIEGLIATALIGFVLWLIRGQ